MHVHVLYPTLITYMIHSGSRKYGLRERILRILAHKCRRDLFVGNFLSSFILLPKHDRGRLLDWVSALLLKQILYLAYRSYSDKQSITGACTTKSGVYSAGSNLNVRIRVYGKCAWFGDRYNVRMRGRESGWCGKCIGEWDKDAVVYEQAR